MTIKVTKSGEQPGDFPASVRATLDLLPHLAWLIQADLRHGYSNRSWRAYTGADAEQLHREGWLGWIHPDDRADALACWANVMNKNAPFEEEWRIRHRSGAYRWFRVTAHSHDDTRSTLWLVCCFDIHDAILREASLSERLRMQDSMLDASVDCIKIVDTSGALRRINRSGRVALGVPHDDADLGMRWLGLLPPEVQARGKRALNQARRGRAARFSGLSVIPGCKPQHWDNILTPTRSGDGKVTGVLCVSREVTLQREAEKRLRIASEIDALTGLLNRRSFKTRLNRTVSKARRLGRSFALMLLDVDHFKQVNDTLGHAAGDFLLRRLSMRLRASVSDTDFVARLGGDEFAIVIGGVDLEHDLVQAIEKLLQKAKSPMTYSGRAVNFGVSVGCAIYPRDAADSHELMKCADRALNSLKASGRGGLRIYDGDMMAAVQRAADQRHQARRIVDDDLIEPRYQPRARLRDGAIVGLGAILSWRCPQNGPQQPNTVAEGFKEYELAAEIGALMQAKILADIAEWRRQGLKVVPVSIKASPVEFLYDNFAEGLLERIERTGVPPSLLGIEVTERALADRGSDYVIRALRVLKAAGIGVTLDDFGSGYSALTCLTHYPVDSLKIDRSIVARVNEPGTLAVVQAIGRLGAGLALEVVAEGINTESQRTILEQAGCGIGMGQLFEGTITAHQFASSLQATVMPAS